MKRKAFVVFFIFLYTVGHSQTWRFRRLEVWGAASIFQYFGDIGGGADRHNLLGLTEISFIANRPGFSFGGIYRYDERWYIQASNSFGFFAQADKNSSRNFSRDFGFSSIAAEVSVQGFYFFVKENEKNYYYSIWNLRERGFKKIIQPFSFYTFIGIGGIFFNVTAKDSFVGSPRFVGNKHAAFSFPIGLGAKFSFTPGFSMALELGRRFTSTDFLDGFTSAWSEHKDVYYILNVKAIYRLPKSKRTRHLFQ